MFRVKICGVTTVGDAQMIAAAGADAIGLNFYPPSKRFVSPDVARKIASAIPPEMVRVGVFVNTPVEEIRETVETVGLDLIQLHGDEPPEFVQRLSRATSRPVMRTFRLAPGSAPAIGEYLQQCAHLACRLRMILIDGYVPGEYGGTGVSADWETVRSLSRGGTTPIVLAGGLTPQNVTQAIEAAHPTAVDVAGGVEMSPGQKDEQLVRAFVKAAQHSLRGEY